VNQLEQALEGEALARISGIKSNGVFGAFVVLLRNTTWKCGEVERLIVNYLRRQLKQCGYNQSSIEDIVEHFESKGKKEQQFFEAVERLENRGIIKIVSNPFASSADGFNTSRNQGGR
jgi:hypothetical protein